MNARQRFDEGDLRGAIELCNGEVRAAPEDPARRTFLFELLCFTGDLERAEKQLDVVGHLDAAAEPACQVYRNILHAERQRRQVLAGRALPEFLGDPPKQIRDCADALQRSPDHPDAVRARAAAAEVCAALRGRVADEPFVGLCDCDDLLAPVLELIVMRDYIWLPFSEVRELEIAAPERARDLVWAPARLVLADATQHRAYIPVLYPGSHEHADDLVRLGRYTDWQEGAGVVRGLGQRTLLVGDNAAPLLEIRQLTVESPA